MSSFEQTLIKISKNVFINAIKFVLTFIYFTFNRIVYKQIYGTTMGYHLSPNFFYIVMIDLKKRVLNFLSCYISVYYRYVDNIVYMIAPMNLSKYIRF